MASPTLSDIQAGIQSIMAQLASMQQQLVSIGQRLTGIEGELQGNTAGIASLNQRLDAISMGISALHNDHLALDTNLGAVRSLVSDVQLAVINSTTPQGG